jgi:putative toxin-antitoxin system antitoxin component (TIGR02293 family)
MVSAPSSGECPRSLHERISRALNIPGVKSEGDLMRGIERGLPTAALDALAERGVTGHEIHGLIIHRRTLSHRKQNHQRLTPDESDRTVRIARIAVLADEVFGDRERASRWLRRATRRYDGRMPIEMLATEVGTRLVEEMLYQIDEGIHA